MKRMKIQKRAELGNRKALIFAILLATLVSVGIGCASATITVCNSGCDYASIQAAVDAGDSGDTIEVHSGTYHEHVDVNKTLSLKGVDTGSGKPVVDAGGNDSAITLSVDDITLVGFNVTNAGGGYSFRYAGILVTSNNNTITNNTASNNNDTGILLRSSSNNTITGNKVSNHWYGIRLDDSCNNTITGNNASNNWCGICLGKSSNNTFTNNTVCSNNDYGIYLFSACNNTFTNNTISNNDNGGIYLSDSGCNNNIIGNTFVNNGLCVGDSYQNTVENNTVNGKPLVYLVDTSDTEVTDAGQVILVNCSNITVENLDLSNTCVGIELYKTHDSIISNNTVSNNNMYGIILWDSRINTITNNTISNNNYGGIYLIDSSCNNNIIGNTFVNDGLFVGYSYQNTVENNTVNGKPLVYLVDTSDTEVTDAGQVILVNCSNITVENLDLSNTCFGIELYKTHDSIISNNTVSNNNMYGIILWDSSINTITGNTISNNNGYGIRLFRSSNNTITGNNVSNSLKDGISLWGSSSNTITGNTACNNKINGIYLSYSSNNTITGNNVGDNQKGGISLSYSSSNTITGNTACNNKINGIYLSYSSNNTITNNNASSNIYGIFLSSSSNNTIYNNYFNNAYNARDLGNNIWNITKTLGTNIIDGPYIGGNYWSDYTGVDIGGDGLGDTLLPYNSSGNITTGGDWLPLVTVKEKPYTKTDVGVNSTIIPASPTDLAAYLPPDYNDTDISDSVVLNVNVTDITPDTTDAAYTDITINVGSMDIETCKVFKTDIGFLPEVEDVTTLPTVSDEPAFSRDLDNKTVTVRLFVGDPLLGVIPAAVEPLGFDTGEGTYPSIMGTHNGTIIPSRDINISKLYTYPCAGTGGHSESIKLYENVTLIASGTWNGYEGDWHNITIDNETGASYVMLLKNHKYNYTIVTGSYPQIIHEHSKEVTGGTITCTSFVDVNGKVYYDWIPAIRLE